MTIGERIKYVRESAGNGKKMTLEAFGQRLRISPQAVSMIEKGANGASDQTIMMICREFNVSEEWLRTGEGEPFLKLDAEEELMKLLGTLARPDQERRKQEFIRILLKLPEEYWDMLADLIDKLYSALHPDEKEKPGS